MPFHWPFSSDKKSFDMKVVEKIRSILNEADGDGDGRLTKEELKKAFNKIGAFFPALRVMLAVNEADKNHDGVISGKLEHDELVEYIYDKYEETIRKMNQGGRKGY